MKGKTSKRLSETERVQQLRERLQKKLSDRKEPTPIDYWRHVLNLEGVEPLQESVIEEPDSGLEIYEDLDDDEFIILN